MLLECSKCHHIISTTSEKPRCSKCQSQEFVKVDVNAVTDTGTTPKYDMAGIKGKMWKQMAEHLEMMQMIQLSKAMATGTQTQHTPQAPPQDNQMINFMEKQNSQIMEMLMGAMENSQGGDEMTEHKPEDIILQSIIEGMKNNPEQTKAQVQEYAKNNPQAVEKLQQENPDIAKKIQGLVK